MDKATYEAPQPTRLKLEEGSRVAVMGGGQAGSFFSYFLLSMAERIGLNIHVDIYEPRDSAAPGPAGCNMCGGIVSESLVQHLAAEGILLPPTVVQRGIDSYILHTDQGLVRIGLPQDEKRIAAVFRGSGPRGLSERKWDSFDGHLQSLATRQGAQVIRARVERANWRAGRVEIKSNNGVQVYDLLAVATGINTAAHRLFEKLEIPYRSPRTTKTIIREYYLGEDAVAHHLGSSMHVFLLNLPHMEFAALVPKGDYATVIMLGDDLDEHLLNAFMNLPEVRHVMPADVNPEQGSCQCQPRIAIRGAVQPYGDRIVFIGDCGVTRLYKDGIGAAYRAAKAAATTAIFEGISTEDFRRHYWPVCRAMEVDNAIGKFIFFVTRLIQRLSFARRAIIRMTLHEQRPHGKGRRMSGILWDTFTGSAAYRDIFLRALNPAFLLRFGWDIAMSLWPVKSPP